MKISFLKQLTTKKLRESLMFALENTPLSVVFSFLTFSLFVYHIAVGSLPQNIENIIGKSIITLIVMFVLSIAVYLYTQTSKQTHFNKWRNQIITLLSGLLFYYSFEENLFAHFYTENIIYIAITLCAVVASVFIAPFVQSIRKKEVSQNDFYVHSYTLIIKIIMATIAGTAAMLFGFIALGTLDTLFNLHISGNSFEYWSAFSMTLFAPLFFLTQLPAYKKSVENTIDTIENTAFYAFLIKYIALPAIAVYFIILYAYTIKVLINFSSWPNGKIAWMVIGFSFFGYIIYIASYIFGKSFKPAATFRKVFPFAVLPQVVMLFYAIFLRINQYDMTINRYLVVAFGVWLSLVSLHFVFSKKKYLGAIPLSLIVVIAIISIGPWSVYSYPKTRQVQHLKSALKEAKILNQDGKLQPLKEYSDIDSKLSGEIYGAIEYLCNNHGCDSLKPLLEKQIATAQAEDRAMFNKQKMKEVARLKKELNNASNKNYSKAKQKLVANRLEIEQKSEYTPMRQWAMTSALAKLLKVRGHNAYSQNNNHDKEPEFITIHSTSPYKSNVIETSNYDYFVPLNARDNYIYYRNDDVEKELPLYEVVLYEDTAQLEISKKIQNEMVMVQSFDMKDTFNTLLQQADTAKKEPLNDISFSDSINDRKLPVEKLTFKLIGQELSAKVVFEILSIPNPKWKEEVSNDADEIDIESPITNKRAMMLDMHDLMQARGYVLIKN